MHVAVFPCWSFWVTITWAVILKVGFSFNGLPGVTYVTEGHLLNRYFE